jgi:hypothetical protein
MYRDRFYIVSVPGEVGVKKKPVHWRGIGFVCAWWSIQDHEELKRSLNMSEEPTVNQNIYDHLELLNNKKKTLFLNTFS